MLNIRDVLEMYECIGCPSWKCDLPPNQSSFAAIFKIEYQNSYIIWAVRSVSDSCGCFEIFEQKKLGCNLQLAVSMEMPCMKLIVVMCNCFNWISDASTECVHFLHDFLFIWFWFHCTGARPGLEFGKRILADVEVIFLYCLLHLGLMHALCKHANMQNEEEEY